MFQSDLSVKKIGERTWKLLEPLIWKAKKSIMVPIGFKTDFASVPQGMWWFCAPASGNHARASVLHDYLYKTGRVSRKEADEIFRDAMKACGVGWFKRNSMFWAVRGFGGSHYS